MEIIAVFIGGGLGSISRFLLSKFINNSINILFPTGTFAVNSIGCLVIGIVYALFEKFIVPNEIRVLLITGFIGGFTTFSSFGLETVALLRSHEIILALINVVGSVISGIFFVVLGMFIVSILFKK